MTASTAPFGRPFEEPGEGAALALRPATGALSRLVGLNRRWSSGLERVLPQARDDLEAVFDRCVVEYQAIAPKSNVAYLSPLTAGQAIAGAGRLPLSDGEVGLLVTRYMLERLPDVEILLRESHRALADDGFAIHLVACRNSPYAAGQRLMSLLRGHRSDPMPLYYDRCTFSELREVLHRCGFHSVRGFFGYNESSRFSSFLPAYVLSAVYETLARSHELRDRASSMLVIAQKQR